MRFTKITTFSLALVVAGSLKAQTVTLAVQPGQKYKVETSVKTNTSAEVMGQSMVSEFDLKTTTSYEVKSSGQDGTQLVSTITGMKVTGSSMGQEFSYDSDKKDNSGPIVEAVGGRINKPRNITLDAKGVITKQDETEGGAGIMMGMADANSSSVELFVPAISGRTLKVGDSFVDVSSMKKDKYSSRDSGTYTVTAIDNGVASISYSGTQIVSAVMEQMGMELNTNSTNTVKTEMQVDITSGVVLLRATVIDVNSTVEAAGMSIPATGKTISTSTITPVK